MGKKRERLEVIHDILACLRDHKDCMKPTRLLHSSNLSPQMFKDYIDELKEKEFIKETSLDKNPSKRIYSLTDKGYRYLERYSTIITFIDDFGL